MYPFIAFVWDPRNAHASGIAAALCHACATKRSLWEPTFSSNGLVVFSRSPRSTDLRAYRLPGASGVVLGRLFPLELRDLTPRWTPQISEQDVAQYLNTAGHQFTTKYWGAYLTFLTAATGDRSVILRDASGRLPCYRLAHDSVDILFADIADLSALPLPPLKPNLRYLAAAIHRSSLEIRETALEEVTELLAGESFERRGAHRRQVMAWNPLSILQDVREPHFKQAATRLHRITQACIDAWASAHPRILHRLSGGLDSAIVLGCLSNAPSHPTVLCLNHYVEDSAGDERAYARLAVARAGTGLIELAGDPVTFVFDARLLTMPPSVKPSFSQCARQLQLAMLNDVAARYRADAIWTGQGGDHLFLKASSIACAADFRKDHGLRWGLLRVIHDEARRTAQPYAWVLESALAPARAQRRALRWAGTDRAVHFVAADALPKDLDVYCAHPWTVAAEGLPPGRRRQISLLADAVNRHRPLSDLERAYEHHPLLSQPIVEHCLRTPTYLHLDGGRHRALARQAFASCVPRAILEREDKGATTQFTVEALRRSERFLCELLLDGALAHERLLTCKPLERCLREGQALRSGQLSPLLACIAGEVWLRTWQRTTRTAPSSRPQ